MANITFTRADYMAAASGFDEGTRVAAHRRYFAQFVTPGVKAAVARHISIARIAASKDPHYNDIPLREWDAVYTAWPFEVASLMKEAGEYLTPAGAVCILKEAARQLVEASNG